MRVGVVGVNHKSADLNLRELLAKACQRRFSPGNFLHGEHEIVLLSTCNRTEVYFSSDDLAATHSYLLRVLRCEVSEEFEHKLYSYFGFDCFAHLCRVTVGMDSAILAETEIQGQVKAAYESAAVWTMLSRDLHFMFQKSLKVGKGVRSSLPILHGISNLEEIVFQASEKRLGSIFEKEILFVGLSEINFKIYSSLKKRGASQITFCNRTLNKLQEFAFKNQLKSLPWQRFHEWHNYDLIIFGTKSPEFLLRKRDLAGKVLGEKLIIDLSVPRNVEPGIAAKVPLLNIDQLNQKIERRRLSKMRELESLEKALNEQTERQLVTFQQRERARTERLELPLQVI